jgi:hypothetical protein
MNTLIILVFITILTVLAWALFGGQNRVVTTPGPDDKDKPETGTDTEPEKILRRRASDRAIEEEFPERRRSDDISRKRIIDTGEAPAPFELPYSANNIIPDNSRFRMYKRILLNSEIYARKGDIDTAISLFNGVRDRISDRGIKNKIDENIEYLNHYREQQQSHLKKRHENLYAGQQPGELRLKIDGPVPHTINIGTGGRLDSEELVNRISGQILKEISQLKDKIDNIRPEHGEHSAGDDSPAVVAGLQQELDSLKERVAELDEERDKTLEELNKIQQIKEKEPALNRDRGRREEDRDRNRLLENLENEISNLKELKHTLDSLNKKIDDMENLRIPEVKQGPRLAEAKYASPEPVHFDTKPVLDVLDKINKASERLKTPEAPAEDIPPSADTGLIETQKEKEIERHNDAEEDPNAFDLLSEYGKTKDDSTLSDDEIFEKILTGDKRKSDDPDFEILGEKQKEEVEYSFDEPMDEKKKAEQDFYKKFIKADRIKKKELPILKVNYDFKKLPDEFSLSREKNILEYSFYKYKPMLEKADEFIKQRRVRDAINYYKVVLDQNIPTEFKVMIKRNIRDLTEYLEKYLASE